MTENILIQQATSDEILDVAKMTGELLTEIMDAIGYQAFNFNLEETRTLLADLLEREKYFVFIAREKGNGPIGFISLCGSCSLYAGGYYGTIPEFYVKPNYRSNGVGHLLISRVKSFGKTKGWKRLEVATPPLPQFKDTMAFYERESFVVTGGRKLKAYLNE